MIFGQIKVIIFSDNWINNKHIMLPENFKGNKTVTELSIVLGYINLIEGIRKGNKYLRKSPIVEISIMVNKKLKEICLKIIF